MTAILTTLKYALLFLLTLVCPPVALTALWLADDEEEM